MDLSIRTMTKRDLPFLNRVRNECADTLHDDRTFTLDETNEWFKKTKPTFQIAFYDRKRAGYIKIYDHSTRNKNVKISVNVPSEYKQYSLDKMIYDRLLSLFFNDYGFHKVSVELLSTNTTIINICELSGFVKSGVKRDEVTRNGEWVDSTIMSITSTEYNKKTIK